MFSALLLLAQGLVVTDLAPVEQPLLAGPQGHYYGTKRVAFYKIKVDARTGEPGFFSLKVNGAPSGDVDCPNEAYAMSGTDLTMPNYETPGDCAHDQFEAAKLKFISAAYDAAKDEVTVVAKWKAIKVTIVGKKVAQEAEELFDEDVLEGKAACRLGCIAACKESPKAKKVCMAGCMAACQTEENALAALPPCVRAKMQLGERPYYGPIQEQDCLCTWTRWVPTGSGCHNCGRDEGFEAVCKAGQRCVGGTGVKDACWPDDSYCQPPTKAPVAAHRLMAPPQFS